MFHPEPTPDSHPPLGAGIVVALLGLLVAGLVFLQWRHAPPAPLPSELDRAQLELVDGRLCLRGTKHPFSGHLLEHYSGGSLQSRSAVLGGRLHGLSEGWDTNGVLQVREIFAQGISDGLRIKWYPSGVKLSEAMVVTGTLEGLYRHWDPEGHLAEEVEMHQGQPDGRSRAYFPSGCLRLEVRLRHGQVVGQTTWKDGEHPVSLVAAQAD